MTISILSLSSCLLLLDETSPLPNEGFTSYQTKIMEDTFGMVVPFLENHSYSFKNTYNEDLTMTYSVNYVNEAEYSTYLQKYEEYNLIGTRSSFVDNYRTYFDTKTYTYMDLVFGAKSLKVYMYHRGSIDYYDTYYTNVNHPMKDLPDDYNMRDAKYSSVMDLSGYNHFCPTKGDIKILVLPVYFSDYPKNNNFTNKTLEDALESKNLSPYPSLKEYYNKSSYGKLNLSFTIPNTWYEASHNSKYYDSSDRISSLVESALQYYDNSYDYKDFDSDNDGAIDGIILVHTIPSSTNLDLSWPATRNNVNENYNGTRNTFDNKYAYRFFHINTDQIYTQSKDYKKEINSYTLIHEFGHMIGLDDYYDTNYTERTFLAPLDGHDVMDAEYTDQDAFSKLILGWISTPKFIKETCEITLSSFEETGDIAIISNNFDETQGVFQEYYIIVYNSGTNLNKYSETLNKEGIIIYHVDGSLYTFDTGETICNYNNDQAGYYSERFNLIEFAKKDYNPYIFEGKEGSASLDLIDNNGLSLKFSLESSSILESDNEVSLKITIEQ